MIKFDLYRKMIEFCVEKINSQKPEHAAITPSVNFSELPNSKLKYINV